MCMSDVCVANSDIFLDWQQSAEEVTVRLRCGEGALKVENVDAAFSDTACQVRLPGKPVVQCCVLSYFNGRPCPFLVL